jgi:alpha-mannosidase
MAFGIERYKADGIENPSNRYVGALNGDDAFVIYNKSGIHSVSKKGKNLYLTLLNGASYCAHPTTPELPLTPKGRFDASVEQGVHDFALRVGANKIEECERIANEFNQPVYQLLYFPHNEKNEVAKDVIRLSNKNIVISALKRRNDGTFLIRLYNGSFNKAETELLIKGIKKNVLLKKFEFKTFVFDGKSIVESKDSSIY